MDLMGSLIAIVAVVIGAALWMLPIVFIGMSDQTSGKEKVAWILAVVFISWFAWVFYLLLAPIKSKDPYSYRR